MPVRPPLFLLAAVLSLLLPRPSKSSPVTLLGNRQVRLLSLEQENCREVFVVALDAAVLQSLIWL